MAKAARKLERKSDTRYQAGADAEVGAVRVEESAVRNHDGSVDHMRRCWKVYQFVELSDDDKRRFTAAALPGKDEPELAKAGAVLKERDWKFVSQHTGGDDNGEAEAREAAEALANK